MSKIYNSNFVCEDTKNKNNVMGAVNCLRLWTNYTLTETIVYSIKFMYILSIETKNKKYFRRIPNFFLQNEFV